MSIEHNQQQPAAAQEAVGVVVENVNGEVVSYSGVLFAKFILSDNFVPGMKLYAAPVTAAPTLDDELAQDRMSELCKLESDVLDVLPSVYYMDPPDGGDVSLGEQVKRMAEDAANWRKHASTPAAPGIDLAALAATITDHLCEQDYDIGGRDELLQHVREAIDASPKGNHFPDATKMVDSPKGGSDTRDAALAELIEADNEFDAADAGYHILLHSDDYAFTNGKAQIASDRLDKARTRRANALVQATSAQSHTSDAEVRP